MIHELKCWPEPFAAVMEGLKTHEVRKNDRGYSVGDVLILREWDQHRSAYLGRKVNVRVSYISEGGTFGLPKDVCVMSVTILGDR